MVSVWLGYFSSKALAQSIELSGRCAAAIIRADRVEGTQQENAKEHKRALDARRKLREIGVGSLPSGQEAIIAANKEVERAFRSRCLIPVSGYYEWQNTRGGKQPWYFTARDGPPALTVAGLWDEWKNRETGEPLRSCTMIITEPNDFVAAVHDRMPVLLTEQQFQPWLTGEAGLEYLKPAPNDLLQKWPVSKRVNSSRADGDNSTPIEEVELVMA